MGFFIVQIHQVLLSFLKLNGFLTHFQKLQLIKIKNIAA